MVLLLQCHLLSELTLRLLWGLNIFHDVAVMVEKPNWLQMVLLLPRSQTLTFTARLFGLSLSFIILNLILVTQEAILKEWLLDRETKIRRRLCYGLVPYISEWCWKFCQLWWQESTIHHGSRFTKERVIGSGTIMALNTLPVQKNHTWIEKDTEEQNQSRTRLPRAGSSILLMQCGIVLTENGANSKEELWMTLKKSEELFLKPLKKI